MIYSLHYLKRPWMKKPALSVTNYVNVWGRSRVLAFASHDISWNVFRHNNFETFIFNTNFQSSLEKPLSHKIIKSNTNLKPLSSGVKTMAQSIFFTETETQGALWCERGKGWRLFGQKTNLNQPTTWPVPHACAKPYHLGSGSHGQLFRPCWGRKFV